MQRLRCYSAVKISKLMPMGMLEEATSVTMDLVLTTVKKEINVVSKYQTVWRLKTIIKTKTWEVCSMSHQEKDSIPWFSSMARLLEPV